MVIVMQKKSYVNLREDYPEFLYKSFNLSEDNESIYISYDFEIPWLTAFKPEIRIDKTNLNIVNDFNSPCGRRIIFLLGMVEAVSYLKAACCPKMIVMCGSLTEAEKLWWKKLYFNGLGEFFYINNITPDFDSFLTIECTGSNEALVSYEMNFTDYNIVPVGGGKDSAVSAELVKGVNDKILFFTVNNQKARTDTVLAAGYSENDIIKTYRKISPELLELNRQGFLNGHTPFSAIVAFLSLYCAYLTGCKNIILSNEASANESNIPGSNINHQYSKSYEFESDFTGYVDEYVGVSINYFSILRPFNELQIAKKFCIAEKYLYCFRSCNAGSKNNIWCCNCPKCLFDFSVLSAFVKVDTLSEVFGENLFEKVSLADDFKGLVGLSPVKPFECVGTISEIKYALALCIERMKNNGEGLPALLEIFDQSFNINDILSQPVMSEFNDCHNIPDEFMIAVNEMRREVVEG